MSEVQVKYQPPVIEYFDIRIDSLGMFTLIQTLRVAVRELEVDESVSGLLDALVTAYDSGPDGDPKVDDAAAAA